MGKLQKILGICLTVFLIMMTISTSVMALNNPGEVSANTSNTGKIQDVGSTIVSTIRVLGMLISVGVLMVLGIKYMMGSAEEKAEYKKTMIPYVVGAVLIFAATFIVSAVAEFAKGV